MSKRSATSQSLWVRDRFLIEPVDIPEWRTEVAIPLGQGQVFNGIMHHSITSRRVAIPLGQGQVFNGNSHDILLPEQVAIPLGQGQVFNTRTRTTLTL